MKNITYEKLERANKKTLIKHLKDDYKHLDLDNMELWALRQIATKDYILASVKKGY